MPELRIRLFKTAQAVRAPFPDGRQRDQLAYCEDVTADRGSRKAPQSDFRNSTTIGFLSPGEIQLELPIVAQSAARRKLGDCRDAGDLRSRLSSA